MNYINTSTEGAILDHEDNPNEYTLVGQQKLEGTFSDESSKGRKTVTGTAKEWSQIVLGLSESVAFTSLIVVVIGYIVISSFDGMKTTGEFWRYIIFIFISFSFYKVLNFKFEVIKNVDIKNRIFITILLFLLLGLIVSNLELISWIFNQLNKLIFVPTT